MEITSYLSECIIQNKPVSFSKYGDGEYFCANSYSGHNCDKDNYTEKKKQGLIDAFTYLSNNVPHAYFGAWHGNIHKEFWEKFVDEKKKPVKWARYHSIILDNDHATEYDNIQDKIQLYKTIHYSSLNKYIVCNPLLIKSQLLFNTTAMINVNFRNWFDNDFENVVEQMSSLLSKNISDKPDIVITCCGMASKILIYELTKRFPNNIYLDFGSAIDVICTKKRTRSSCISYEEFYEHMKEIIPNNWNDPIYQSIYNKASVELC
jgi:hypothetical protein